MAQTKIRTEQIEDLVAANITDFDTEVSNNTDVAANTSARHDAVTVSDSAEINFTLTGQDITASLVAASIDESKLDSSVNASLDLADTSLQPEANVVLGDITSRDNETNWNYNLSVTSGSSTHAMNFLVDGNVAMTISAVGNGAGGVGDRTIKFGNQQADRFQFEGYVEAKDNLSTTKALRIKQRTGFTSSNDLLEIVNDTTSATLWEIGAEGMMEARSGAHLGDANADEIWIVGAVEANATDNRTLQLKQIASQTSNMFNVTDSSDTNFFYIDSNFYVYVSDRIVHNGDEDTRINFADNNIAIAAGNREIARFTQTILTVNENAVDIDFEVKGDTDGELLYINAGTDRVGISTATPSTKFHVADGKSTFATPTTSYANIRLLGSSSVDPSTPENGDLWYNGTNLYFYNGTSNIDLLDNSSVLDDGWKPADSMTATSFNGTANIATMTITGSDETGTYEAGMRIRFKQTAIGSDYIYGIIVAVVLNGSDTDIYVYTGNNYDVTASSAVTLQEVSREKAPQGFILTPDIWTQEYTDSTLRTQASPTATTWYNLGSAEITIPRGSWYVSYFVSSRLRYTTQSSIEWYVTLSSANNTESDTKWTTHFRNVGANVTNHLYEFPARKSGIINATSGAGQVFYLNTKTDISGTDDLVFANDEEPLILRATCAYL